ncbi:Helicase and polymerase-containing protein, partial [Drosera capensis]
MPSHHHESRHLAGARRSFHHPKRTLKPNLRIPNSNSQNSQNQAQYSIRVSFHHSSTESTLPMASDSSRARIDQFYSSKKRRAVSPGAKSGEIEEDVRTGKDGSPSAKGSSKGFLVCAESEGVGSKNGPVKRNLTSEIGSLIRCERKEVVVSDEVGFRVENGGAGLGGGGGERSELKKFAAGFLSLYC